MAHFAEIDDNNVVLRVLVVDNSLEHRGEEFLANDLKLGGRWIQTSYNGTFRKHFAMEGYTYDEARDAFIPPITAKGWVLEEESLTWFPPVEQPSDAHVWDEETESWIIP